MRTAPANSSKERRLPRSRAIVVAAFIVTGGVGVFFGYYPAWRASRLDPSRALRVDQEPLAGVRLVPTGLIVTMCNR